MVSAGAPSHSPVTASDLELLDMLTSMSTNSSFPHMSFQPRGVPASAANAGPLAHAHAQQHPTTPPVDEAAADLKRKPLSTLQALRRPPIDPIILAASLSSGPHVTRHHFHHSFAGRPDERKSHQMPASERRERLRKLELENQQRRAGLLDDGAGPSTSVSAPPPASASRPRRKTVTQVSVLTGEGKYASCDLGTDEELEAEGEDADEESGEALAMRLEEERVKYVSAQAPRSVRLQQQAELRDKILASQRGEAPTEASTGQAPSAVAPTVQEAHVEQVARAADVGASDVGAPPKSSNPSEQIGAVLNERRALVNGGAPEAPSAKPAPTPSPAAAAAPPAAVTPLTRGALSSIVRPPPISVRCYARTRIPTPHGEIFCHLYRNNHDAKEHLALVVDPSQNDEASMHLDEQGRPPKLKGTLRSRTLDEKWGEEETEMERIVRGAYVGRLGPSFQMASDAIPRRRNRNGQIEVEPADEDEVPALVRIHSECYTGETIGSQRCDCGEQLDEAIRLIHQSGTEGHPARGVVVYLRQEGRGIGLLDKLMAYNLQDMGHDTVSANILLGHLADARKYDVASAILRDLGISQCRLLTNNPEKMEALEAEGVRVCQRVAMIPRAWRVSKKHRHKRRTARAKAKKSSAVTVAAAAERSAAAATGASTRVQRRDGSTASSASGRRTKKSKGVAAAAAHPNPKRRLQLLENLESSVISQAASNATTDDDYDDADDDEEVRASALGARHQASDVEVEDFDEQDDGHEAFSDDDDDEERFVSEEEEEEEDGDSDSSADSYVEHVLRRSGATMLGASVTRGVELERYLRTKVERMGHMLELPSTTSDEGHERHAKKDRTSAVAKSKSAAASRGGEVPSALGVVNDADAESVAGTDPEPLLDDEALDKIASEAARQ